MTPEQKKARKALANDFNLHVSLIMRDDVGKAEALVTAYGEGRTGLNARLNPKGEVR